MDSWFLSKKGWRNYTGYIDRRCYPNSRGRGVHIWGSQAVDGEPSVVAGFATFSRLQICEMFEFLGVLYKVSPGTYVLLEARGVFFDAQGGGQLLDFEKSVGITKSNNVRLDASSKQVVPDGHYMWLKRQGSRLTTEMPLRTAWLLSSRVITAQGSGNASGTATPNRDDSIRHKRRQLDGRCRVTGKLAPDRGQPRGKDWTTLHSAHVFPLGWSVESKMKQMFSTDAFKKVKELGLHETDLTVNTILMDARAHAWFDDYRFGIWPVEEKGSWYGKIFRFEQGRCDVDGEWLLAAARPAKFPQPNYGQPETSEQREARERDEKEREEDKTRYDMTNEPVLRELLKVHFETCLHWHVKGMGWDK
ncbi:hypothetical protein FB451DRAFT_1378357 [Mycena latifolia]|nr:hypothetical protein FB451DRAFT_1573853 [Mycena latifolia]KAJ7438182.1 hypothetical protein FB451DRAFT_1378357 [Mycena latifolia]